MSEGRGEGVKGEEEKGEGEKEKRRREGLKQSDKEIIKERL